MRGAMGRGLFRTSCCLVCLWGLGSSEPVWSAAAALEAWPGDRARGGSLRGTLPPPLELPLGPVVQELQKALVSIRLATVDQALSSVGVVDHLDSSTARLVRQVQVWRSELDKRLTLRDHCVKNRGQGWDGPCLLVDSWWRRVRYHTVNAPEELWKWG
uniref:Uncharacterized protein n=1 Tax=Rhizochromulina marina TaxID=1034831 RepID=A0A7S2SF76_9STRA